MKTYVDFKLEKNLSSELLNMDKTYDFVIKPLKKWPPGNHGKHTFFLEIELVTTKIVNSKSLKKICRQLLSAMNVLKSDWCQGPSEFIWPWVFLNGDLLVGRHLSGVASVCLRSLFTCGWGQDFEIPKYCHIYHEDSYKLHDISFKVASVSFPPKLIVLLLWIPFNFLWNL